MSVVEEALKMTSVPQFDLAAMREEMDKLLARQHTLLGVESDLKNRMRRRAEKIQNDVEAVKVMQQCPVPLLVLDPAVLTWRHEKTIRGVRVPRLAPVTVRTPTTIFSQQIKNGKLGSSLLEGPKLANSRYLDVFTSLGDVGFREGRRELSFTFEGAIPNDARDLILTAQGYFDDTILLVDAPLTAWNLQVRKKTLRERMSDRLQALDPIIVGTKARRLWVIGSFDITPVEQYVLEQFTAKQLEAGS